MKIAETLTTSDQPYTQVRDCTVIKARRPASVGLAQAPARLRTPKKIAPISREFYFSADGKRVLYVEPGASDFTAVPADGGTAKKLPASELASMVDANLKTILEKYQELTHENITPLSTRFVAIDKSTGGANLERLFIADVATGQVTPVAPDGLYIHGAPLGVDDHRVAFIGHDRHIYIADAAKHELTCASAQATVEIDSFFASQGGYILFRAGPELHGVDVLAGIDTVITTLPAEVQTVEIQPIPYRPVGINAPAIAPTPGFVVHVDVAKQMQFFLVDAKEATIVRLTDVIPGWTSMWVAPDGKHVVFSRGAVYDPDWRPPKPPSPDRKPRDTDADDGPGTCDPIGCRPGTGDSKEPGCGWQTDGCGDYNWCGPCPDGPKPPLPLATDGLYTFKL